MTKQEEEHQEANEFAGYLLVPPAMLKRELVRLGGVDLAGDGIDVKALAKKFGVTETLIAYRIGQETAAKP